MMAFSSTFFNIFNWIEVSGIINPFSLIIFTMEILKENTIIKTIADWKNFIEKINLVICNDAVEVELIFI
jgi:hypothetical protein